MDFAKEKTAFDVREIEKHFKEGVEDNHKCLRDLFNKRNCSYNCNILSFGEFPPCKTLAQQRCMWKDMYKGQAGQDYLNCYKTKKATLYKVRRIETPIHDTKNDSTTEFYIGFWSSIKEIQEELPLLTTQDFIGSVGGTLGMFFGFSISATLLFCIDKMLDRMEQTKVSKTPKVSRINVRPN